MRMPVFEYESKIRAPFQEVWAFSRRVSGLQAITPDWLRLRVESVDNPESETTGDELAAGSRVHLSVKPFRVWPRQSWTSVILECKEGAGTATLKDEMVDGPFPRWIHTHRFLAECDATTVRDRVEYRLPGGPIGEAISPFGRLGLDPIFRYRHWKTRQLLE